MHKSIRNLNNHCISYTNHTYSGLLLVKSDVYNGDIHLREIKRTYDNANNLITLESNELTSNKTRNKMFLYERNLTESF